MARMLTDEQLRSYRDTGIVFPLRVLSAEEARRYCAASDELENQLGGKPRTIEVRQMHLHFRWAYELATQPRILDAVQDLLGPDLLVWATELFAKHPEDRTVTIGWHRDKPYMGFDAADTVTAWVALSPSTAANGCLRVVPGTGGQTNVAGDGARIEVNESAALDVELQAGEMSLHDGCIIHGSRANCSRTKRVGFAIRFVRPSARPLQGRPSAMLVRGRDAFAHFEPAEPPSETDTAVALARLKQSAAHHLKAMLHNLRHAER